VAPGAALRTSLPEGTVPVALALLIAGIATYLFFKIGKDAVGGADAFKPIASLWFATFALAPGFFLPLEQELGRALAHRRAVNQGGQPVVRRIIPLALMLAGIVSVTILLASGKITDNFFDGDWVVTAALIVGFLAYLPVHLARGICSGHGRFASYGITDDEPPSAEPSGKTPPVRPDPTSVLPFHASTYDSVPADGELRLRLT
jgi:hypothetical protein